MNKLFNMGRSKITLIFFLLLICKYSFSDSFPYLPEKSIGFIIKSSDIDNLAMQIHVPRELKIPIFNDINSKSNGYLFFPKCKYATKQCWENYFYINDQKYNVSVNDFTSVAYDAYCLKYYSSNNKFIRILDKSIRGGVWICIDDLNRLGYSNIDWLTFIKKRGRNYFPVINLNLRAKPSEKSELIIKMIPHEYTIDVTGEYNGLWAQVKVKKIKFDYDSKEIKILNQYQGWCKIIDNSGFPNVYFGAKD